MKQSPDTRFVRLRSGLLYAGYLSCWLVAAIIAFKLLLPQRWAQISGDTHIHADNIEQLHHQIAQSRWPLNVHRYHPTIGYELTPGVSARLRDHSFHSRTHELGFRIPLAQDQQAIASGGILSVGCSFTYGDQVEAEQALTFVAAEFLGLPSYNYGVVSYSYVSALLKLEELERGGIFERLQPSALVLGAGGWLFERSTNPFYPTMGPQFGYAYLAKESDRVLIKQPPARFSLKHQFEFNEVYFPLGRRELELTEERKVFLEKIAPTAFEARILKSRWKTNVTKKDLYGFIVKRLHEMALSHDIPALIFWFLENANNDEPPQELIDAVNNYENVYLLEGGNAVIDLKQRFLRGHPTKEAHRRYGELMAQKLQSLSL